MAEIPLDKDKRAIAANLIATCGLQRAVHAARQYGWYDIAREISAEIERASHAGEETPETPPRH